MKRIFLLLFVIILSAVVFSACADSQPGEQRETVRTTETAGIIETVMIPSKENDTITFETGIYDNKNWEDPVGTYKGAVIPNKDAAVEVASAIFKGINKSETPPEEVPQYVFYDETDGIWIVSFWKDRSSLEIGNDCSIAIQASDGKVLRIWIGE